MIEEIWDKIVEEFEYFISFEWVGDTWEFVTGIFDNLQEFSIIGTVYGVIMVGLVYLFRNYVFVFVDTMGTVAKLFWYIVFYIVAFIMGYLVGRKVWE